jgi:hypothetical protein
MICCKPLRLVMDVFVSTGVQLLSCLWNAAFRGAMNQPVDPLLVTIVLGILALGLPIFLVLAIRFLWDRNLNLGRSKELEKLIWQLHRIASALEHQMNLTFPAVQPGTEEARDLAYLQQLRAQPSAANPSATALSTPTPSAAIPSAAAATPVAPQAVLQQPVVQQPAAPAPAAQQAAVPGLELREPSADAPRAGVNSMFGL